MKMEHHDFAVKLRFDLVLNIGRCHEHPAEIARRFTAFPTPHPDRDRTPQSAHVQPSRGARFRARCHLALRSRRFHPAFLIAAGITSVMSQPDDAPVNDAGASVAAADLARISLAPKSASAMVATVELT
jgi:hypothetical protein